MNRARRLIVKVINGMTVLEAVQEATATGTDDPAPRNVRAYTISREDTERKFSKDEALAILKSIGGSPDKVDLNQFMIGLGVEWEHADTVGGDLGTIGRIVLDHLDERPDYYDVVDQAGLE